jgi:hypothetical protein
MYSVALLVVSGINFLVAHFALVSTLRTPWYTGVGRYQLRQGFLLVCWFVIIAVLMLLDYIMSLDLSLPLNPSLRPFYACTDPWNVLLAYCANLLCVLVHWYRPVPVMRDLKLLLAYAGIWCWYSVTSTLSLSGTGSWVIDPFLVLVYSLVNFSFFW